MGPLGTTTPTRRTGMRYRITQQQHTPEQAPLRPGHQPANQPVRATRIKLCTRQSKIALRRGDTSCPRWDSNCIPALENTGNALKHAESGAVRRLFGPVRDEKCGHCPHPLSGALEDYRGTRCLEISAAAFGRSIVPAATPTTRSKPSSVVKSCR